MKILIVYYSRHNHTKIVGDLIGKLLKGVVEEIIDIKDRSHLINWEKSVFDEELRTPTKIKPMKSNPKDFDLVIVGSPIWHGITPALRAYLKQNKGKFRKIALFTTFSASAENADYVVEKLSGKKPISVLGVQDRQIWMGEHKRLIREFCERVKKLLNIY
ncbi:hypothetical protein CMI42_05910 [Candidatus Pacearchaeota archaeon]|nr:hypothetical protein [Candidatus Pacearchaeota archaeon]